MHLCNFLLFWSGACPSEPSKQLQAKLIKQAACRTCVEQQVCYYSGDDEKNVMIFVRQLNFLAKEDCFYYHPLINWAITELLRQPESRRSTPMDRSEIQSGIRYHPQEKTPQIKTVPSHKRSDLLLTPPYLPPVFSFHVFSLVFPLIKTLNWLTRTCSGEGPLGKNLHH